MTPGPHATIILHPVLDSDQRQIRNVASDVVGEGYFVVVVRYQRKINNAF